MKFMFMVKKSQAEIIRMYYIYSVFVIYISHDSNFTV